MLRVAVVTPYCQEDDDILMRCHRSVADQTHACSHILVADGYPRDVFDGRDDVMHVRLPAANADCGNTPRAIGGLLANSYGFDAVAYLDADNWYEPTHIERLVAAQTSLRHPLVCCKRKFYDPLGNHIPVTEAAEDTCRHVDTSCWLICRPAFSLLSSWLMPKAISSIGDRVFLQKALHERFVICATNARTVCYVTRYATHFVAAGLPVPAGGKGPEVLDRSMAYLRSTQGTIEVARQLGFYPDIARTT